MKKLMFMLAAVAMAIGVQANSVVWSASVSGATTAGISASDYSIYLLDNSKWDTYVSSGAMDAAYLTDAAYDNSGFTLNGTKIETGSQTAEGISASSINYAIVLVNSDASQYAVLATGTSATYDPETQSAVVIDPVSTTGKRVLGTASSGNLTWNSVGGGGGGEPEPTSGLLMLVGLGVLGLRRKMK